MECRISKQFVVATTTSMGTAEMIIQQHIHLHACNNKRRNYSAFTTTYMNTTCMQYSNRTYTCTCNSRLFPKSLFTFPI